MSNPINTSF